MTEEEKAAQKAKPVATTPIPGTPWYVVGLFICLLHLIVTWFILQKAKVLLIRICQMYVFIY